MSARKLGSAAIVATFVLLGLVALSGPAAAQECGDQRTNKVYSDGETSVYVDDSGDTCTETDSGTEYGVMGSTFHEVVSTVTGSQNAADCTTAMFYDPASSEPNVGRTIAEEEIGEIDRVGRFFRIVSITEKASACFDAVN